MIKRTVKDVGMRQHVQEVFTLTGPLDAEQAARLEAFMESVPRAEPGDWPGDTRQRENARRCRAILGTVGLSDEGKGRVDTEALRAKGLNEASAQWNAAHWLAEYNFLMRARERFEGGENGASAVAMMLQAAEEMGRLEERMWWRSGIDRTTGERRERLAVERRDQRRAFAGASHARNAANAAKREDAHALAAVAQHIADDYWRRHPGASKSRVAAHVADRWPDDCGIPRPKWNTIRQRIEES